MVCSCLLVLLAFREFLPAHRRLRRHRATTATTIAIIPSTTTIPSTISNSPHGATASIHTPTRGIAGADFGTAGESPLDFDLHEQDERALGV
jgi:hypothetical protein